MAPPPMVNTGVRQGAMAFDGASNPKCMLMEAMHQNRHVNALRWMWTCATWNVRMQIPDFVK